MERLFLALFLHLVNAQSPADYPNNVPGSCGQLTRFDCLNGRCIDFQLVRNCNDDCGNGEDEKCGANQILCDSKIGSGCGKCVQTSQANASCLDRRYSRICDEGIISQADLPIFKCVSTQNCVLFRWLNDRSNDCGDWSDEDPCLGGFNCSQISVNGQSRFTYCTCKQPYSSGGTAWSSPDPLLASIPGSCTANPLQFDCGNGRCIGINQFRNCVPDCPNGLDEQCWLGTTMCSDGCTCAPTNAAANVCPSVSTIFTGTSTVTTVRPTTTSSRPTAVTTASAATVTTTTRNTATTSGVASGTTTPTRTTGGSVTTGPSSNPTNAPGTTRGPTATSGSPTQPTSTGTRSTGSPTTTSPSSGNCPTGSFHCRSGECVPERSVLDNVQDCADGSDENYCTRVLTCSNCAYVPMYHNFSCGCPPLTQRASTGFCAPIGVTPLDCADLAKVVGNLPTGVYSAYRPNCPDVTTRCTTPIRCDDSNGGGWTVIQRRADGTQNFLQNWQTYKAGFGDQSDEFWQGNDYISSLTSRQNIPYEMMLLMTSKTGQTYRYRYDRFVVAPETSNYSLTLGRLTEGDADRWNVIRNRPFGTYDRDTDTVPTRTCGLYLQSGWWFEPNCDGAADINVPYVAQPQMSQLTGLTWPTGNGQTAQLASSQIMIRPADFSLTTGTPAITMPPRTGQNGANGSRASSVIIYYSLITIFIITSW